MYLKSLILKGFKSFADRSVLTLEPGITAIVGPNGSGKSNISDAVLWVLGERSARNLRGQAMEDIIFSGSAARKAVAVAEVDLVLDNSDKTLPIEFDEVVIARKMYRSGESEYLVNGVVARRLDVLDILHDTGLGTGTHSIISQGSLDSILQSRPEDRRALIEEAAGVLKHKQRKEKSARKLAAMDNHLARVRDVTAEVERQLKPLERKAKRAEAYKEASAQLAEVKLALAVDDLRRLQEQWEKACKVEQDLVSKVEQQRETVSAAEQKVSDFQELMRRESEDAGETAKKQRRAANLVERLDGAEMLLRERRRAAVAAEADLKVSLEGAAQRKDEAAADLEQATQQMAAARQSAADIAQRAKELEASKGSYDERLGEAQELIERIAFQIRECEQAADEARREREFLQESLANGLAHVKLVEARKVELTTELGRVKEEHAAASAAAQKARAKLAELEEAEAAAQAELVSSFEKREAAHDALDAARQEHQLAKSEIAALERSLAASREEDPALAWLLANAERFGGDVSLLSGALKVSGGLDALVEGILGEDLSALSVADARTAESIAEALVEGRLSGDVSLMLLDPLRERRAQAGAQQQPLLGKLGYSPELAPVVEALLGDVVLCATREEAFALAAKDDAGLRYASEDGCIVYPNGKVKVLGARDEADAGILACERKLDELRSQEERLIEKAEAADGAAKAADEAYRSAQAASLKLSQQLANQKGESEAAKSEEERTASRLASVAKEAEDIDKQVETAKKTVDEIRPEMERVEGVLSKSTEQRAELITQRDEKAKEVDPLRAEAERVASALSEAKLEAAKLDERKRYAERIVDARRRDIDSVDEEAEAARRTLVVKRAAIGRGQKLLGVFARIAEGLSLRARVLEEAVNANESATSTAHAGAAEARDAARKAHDAFDAASELVSQARVEKSRLEVQVETAVNVVVAECATPLEVAEQLPALEDRLHAEDERYRLERRIKNMGTINPDAAEEYAALKERYDYLRGQLDDVEAARRSLNRIVRVIDARMKDDFINTFNEVNANFGEVFSLLFPGGKAHLSLVDPDDIENSGVEVTAQPRGKRLTKMMLMSGGEKSLTALALLFAVYKTRTTPFYILDEVEAALDDTNLRRLISYIDSLRDTTQLIMITHQRRTMEMADVLFGVSMQADGVTKVISQKLERALEQAS